MHIGFLKLAVLKGLTALHYGQTPGGSILLPFVGCLGAERVFAVRLFCRVTGSFRY